MKRNLLLSLLAVMLAFTARATAPGTVTIDGDRLCVDLSLPLRDYNVKSNQMLLLTPAIVSGQDTLRLQSVALMGRARYIQYLRGNNDGAPVPATVFRASKAPEEYAWHETPYLQPWMNSGKMALVLLENTYKCANCNSSADDETPLEAEFMFRRPVNLDGLLVFETPEAEAVKQRNLSGRANVEFPVNKTTLLPDFRNNSFELAKIRASIDSVRNDKDVTIRDMRITGYASPEGSYANNTRLAKGRTEAVRAYVNRLYSFPAGLVSTNYVPEDWEGLRAWVAGSDLEDAEGILSIIDNTRLAPDARDAKIRSTYPQAYAYLLSNVYPSLRHTDYRINYTVRSYSSPEEILEIIKTRPGNLSLNEFFVAANSLEPGSELYNEVFDIAVRVYPDDPVANINSAVNALQRNDLAAAEKYLKKADDRPLAEYARGILALLQGDNDTAERLLQRAAKAGVSQADDLLEQLPAIRLFDEAVTKRAK